MKRTVYLYLLDTMADREPGYAIAELNTGRYFQKCAQRLEVRTVAVSKAPVVTMGGVRVTPDISLDGCRADGAAALILPGGDTWLEPVHAPLFEKVGEFLRAGVPVAAICGATAGLAQAGFLNERAHTSNDIGYLKAVCPAYAGESLYRNEPAVTDGNLITATGLAPLEFARELIRLRAVFSPRTLDAWYSLYLTREANCYHELLDSIR